MYKYLITIPLFLFIMFCNSFFVLAAETGASKAINGLDVAANEAYGNDKPTDIRVTIGKIVGSILSFVGVIFLILMIYGGFTWMIARGNEKEVETAKEIITNAVIGLIIVLAAYAITAYIGSVLIGET